MRKRVEVASRDLHMKTALATRKQAVATIVIPGGNAWFRAQGERIASALKSRSGIALPVEADSAWRNVSRLDRNLILLGNRDSNLAIKKLYYLHYTLLDARYPGPGGSELRSLHNPFGDGHNILFAGGADQTGVARAVDQLIAEIESTPLSTDGSLRLGFLQKIHLGKGLTPPDNAKDGVLWERSVGYGNAGYFGWNLISRNLALFYMTGREQYAKEFLRLAFPDGAAVRDLLAADKEGFDDPSDPLAKPYHYSAYTMILYWDLVEEHPFFSDEIRQRVTRKFAEQYDHRVSWADVFQDTNECPSPALPTRHNAWEAVSKYALARYFNKYYPGPDVTECLRKVANVFDAFNRRLAIPFGTLHWYNTYIEPAFVYAALSDPLAYEGNPMVREYANILALLSDRRPSNWSTRFSSIFLLNLAASLTSDQGIADLVRDTGQNTTGFRIGQSYWPAHVYPNNIVEERTGRVQSLQFDAAAMRWDSDFPKEEVIDLISYRQHSDTSGDYLLLDTKYETGRNPFHNFALISLRLDGQSLLRGYANQIQIYSDGLYASEISKYARVTACVRLGDTLAVRAEVSNQNRHHWRRTFLLRENRFLVAFDEVTSLEDVHLAEINSDWQTPDTGQVQPIGNEFQLTPGDPRRGGTRHYTLGCSLPAETSIVSATAALRSSGQAARFAVVGSSVIGKTVAFATVLRPGPPQPEIPAAAQADRQGDGGIALHLPHPALLDHDRETGSLQLLEADHAFGLGVKRIPGLLTAEEPVDVDYNAARRRLVVHSTRPVTIHLEAENRPVLCQAGETVLTLESPAPLSADPEPTVSKIVSARLTLPAPPEQTAPLLREDWRLKGLTHAFAIERMTDNGHRLLAVADGNRVRIITPEGDEQRVIETSDTVGALYWWKEPRLLMIGSRDDKVRAIDPKGHEQWVHTAAMSAGLVESRKFYWFKDVIPGITALNALTLSDGCELLFVGATSTVEIVDVHGKLEGSFYQPWGAVDGLVPVPASDGRPVRMLGKRSRGSWPSVYEIFPAPRGGWQQQVVGGGDGHGSMIRDLAGIDLGSFGFSMVGHRFLRVEKLTADAPAMLVGDFNGAHNRLMLWNLEGRPLREVNLGSGFIATGIDKNNYGRSTNRALNVRGLEVVDLDGDDAKEIVVATDRGYVLAFDYKFKRRFVVRLRAHPLLLTAIERPGKPSLVATADDTGEVRLLDADGATVAEAAVSGKPTVLFHEGGRLLVGSDAGELVAFSIP